MTMLNMGHEKTEAKHTNRILLVEDDSLDVYNIRKSLSSDFDISTASTFKEGLSRFTPENTFDLCILDASLPDGDGIEFCRFVREDLKNKTVPIMMLTGRKDIGSKVAGFGCGADDFLSKPFEPLELRARIDSLLRRSRLGHASQRNQIGPLTIDTRQQKAFFKEPQSNTESDLRLSQTEFRCLDLLASNEGQVFSREQILEKVWGSGIHVCDRNVDSFMSRLRKKNGLAKYIKSRYGLGYVFSLEG